MEKCPVCKKDAQPHSTNSPSTIIECRACGKYEISNQLKSILSSDTRRWPKLSAVLREYYETNNEPQILNTYNYDELHKKGELVKLSERIKKFLNYLASKTKKFGEEIKLNKYADWSLAYCYDENELEQFLHELHKQELIFYHPTGGLVTNDEFGKILNTQVKLTYKAWVQLFESSEGVNSNKVFLAYDFKSEEVETAIKAVRECLRGLSLDPIDLKTHFPDHDQKITDKIIAEIRSAKFIIADCSIKTVNCENKVDGCPVRNANVYFEAGFSMGLGKAVVYICEKNCLSGLPFDTSQYSHVPWDINRLDDFKQRLKERILAYKLA